MMLKYSTVNQTKQTKDECVFVHKCYGNFNGPLLGLYVCAVHIYLRMYLRWRIVLLVVVDLFFTFY